MIEQVMGEMLVEVHEKAIGNGKAAAYLYPNGNALFFDEYGEQIPEFQEEGLCGLHGFVKRCPHAPVYWAMWRAWTYPIPPSSLPYLLACLREKREEAQR